jgi:hypothetical protein
MVVDGVSAVGVGVDVGVFFRPGLPTSGIAIFGLAVDVGVGDFVGVWVGGRGVSVGMGVLADDEILGMDNVVGS